MKPLFNLGVFTPLLFVLSLSASSFDPIEGDQIAVRYAEGNNHQMMVNHSRMDETSMAKGYVSASYTYWIAHEAGTRTFRTNDVNANQLQENAVQGRAIWPQEKATSGFKVIAGLYFPQDSFSFDATYTWFKSPNDTYRSYNWEGGMTAWSPWVQRTDWRGADQLKIYLQTLRLALSASFSPLRIWTIEPSMGLFGAIDRQKFFIYSTNAVLSNETFIMMHQRWWGVGPQAGVQNRFKLWGRDACETTLKGSISFAELLARCHTNFHGMTAQTPQQVRQWHYSRFWSAQPHVQLVLGVEHEHRFFSERKFHTTIGVDWELQTFFDHNALGRHGDTSETEGYLSIQGLTVNFGAMF